MHNITEKQRLDDVRGEAVPWKKWGPFLSERQWGTVREDYSDNGNAWDYFSRDQARSRAYRWGEDGLAGVSDDKQRVLDVTSPPGRIVSQLKTIPYQNEARCNDA
jgi:hypothetical protein